MRLSNQALGAIMMALQNSLLNQTDIVPVLKGFDLMLNESEEVVVLNPPVTEASLIENNENKSTVGSD